MNYFELFGLPRGFFPDPVQVKRKYYELSRQYHPDFFVQSGEAALELAEEKLKEVHAAYAVLSDADKTMAYVLDLEIGLPEGEKYTLSPDFLMEMMEMNEALQEADTEQERGRVREQIMSKKKELYEDIEPVLAGYQQGVVSPEAMLQVKAYYYQQKYISRLLDVGH